MEGDRAEHQSWTEGQDERHHGDRDQAEQRQVDQIDVSSNEGLGLGGHRAEQQSLTGDQDEHHHEGISNSSSSSRHSNTQQIRQPLTIQRAVVRYVERPVDNNPESEITNYNIGTTFETEEIDQAEQGRPNLIEDTGQAE